MKQEKYSVYFAGNTDSIIEVTPKGTILKTS
jgi:hypothetical protein